MCIMTRPLVTPEMKIAKLEGLVDTIKLTEWESKFVESLAEIAMDNRNRTYKILFTGRQLRVLNELHEKHFV